MCFPVTIPLVSLFFEKPGSFLFDSERYFASLDVWAKFASRGALFPRVTAALLAEGVRIFKSPLLSVFSLLSTPRALRGGGWPLLLSSTYSRVDEGPASSRPRFVSISRSLPTIAQFSASPDEQLALLNSYLAATLPSQRLSLTELTPLNPKYDFPARSAPLTVRMVTGRVQMPVPRLIGDTVIERDLALERFLVVDRDWETHTLD